MPLFIDADELKNQRGTICKTTERLAILIDTNADPHMRMVCGSRDKIDYFYNQIRNKREHLGKKSQMKLLFIEVPIEPDIIEEINMCIHNPEHTTQFLDYLGGLTARRPDLIKPKNAKKSHLPYTVPLH